MSGLVLDPRHRTAGLAALAALAMAGLGFASVPLYRLFCAATGLNGTIQRSEGQVAPGAVAGKSIVIRFDANRSSALPWDFKPEQPATSVTIGARNIAFFVATNLTDQPVTGQASYNVAPVSSGIYFHKIQCFCFTKQTLQPGQSVRMPVMFYVDPKLLTDPDTRAIEEITLSYTFYKVDANGTAS
jgi:cytochrome c oxidase assembly protein subunit 11